MSFYVVALLSLSVVLTAIVLMLIFSGSVPRLFQRSLRKQHGDRMQGADIYFVAYLQANALSVRNVQVLSQIKRGLLLVGPGQIALAVREKRNHWVMHELPREESTATLMDVGTSIPAYPSFIHLRGGVGSFYVSALNRLMKGDKKRTVELLQKMRLFLRDVSTKQALETPPVYRVAMLATLALTLIVAGFLIHSALNKYPVDTPLHMAGLSDQRVVMASRDELLTFVGGVLQQPYPLSGLDIHGIPSDLVAVSDNEFLVAGGEVATIYHCQFEPLQCNEIIRNTTKYEPILEAMAVTQTPDAAHVLIADTSRHRILVYSVQGELIQELLVPAPICFPNQLFFENDGFFVVNTNHHQIERFSYDLKTLQLHHEQTLLMATTGREQVNCPQPNEAFHIPWLHREKLTGPQAKPFSAASKGRVWPIAAVKTESEVWWVLLGNRVLTFADMIRIEDNQNKQLLSGELHDPVALTQVGDEIWVSDLEEPTIHRFDRAGQQLDDLRGDALDAWFVRQHDEESRNSQRYYILIGVLVVVLLLMFGALFYRIRLGVGYLRGA